MNNLTGEKFGKLTVLERDFSKKRKGTMWKCVCECGNITIANACDLKRGHYKSCGKCTSLRRNGMSSSKIFHVWYNMKSRCYDTSHPNYKEYGLRGITVCDEWKEDFEAFCNWAKETGYKQGLSLDRIDINGNYEPSNCRWATQSEQVRNRRNTLFLTHNGDRKTLAEWCEIEGEKYPKIYQRYVKIKKKGIIPDFEDVFYDRKCMDSAP